MASQLSETEILDLRKIFLNLDENNDGTLTLDELTEGKINGKYGEIIKPCITKKT